MPRRANKLLLITYLMCPILFGKDVPTIEKKTKGMKYHNSIVDIYSDNKSGEIFIEIEKFNKEFLYIRSLSAGVGSNDIGLDRAQLGGSHSVEFKRFGPKILMIEKNYTYRSDSKDIFEKKAVKDAFAESTIWGFPVEAQSGKKVLINATEFLLRDAHNVSGQLKQTGQGDYKLDMTRSAIYDIRAFPKNSIFEVIQTFVGTPKGRFIREVAPSPSAVTVRQHHAFTELPEDGYKLRKFDPRAGVNGLTYFNYSASLDDRVMNKVIYRHRLERKDSSKRASEPIEPIVYYIDRSIPEPIRSAAFDGARWWNQAFEEAGYRDGFIVKILPENADPMDIRYNVVNWVHRATRGWSYGSSIADPRTGEIIKGHVTLGSLRLRQDYLLAEGLMAPYENQEIIPEEMKKMALSRLSQLVAHEIGHTLGLPHNFISSAQGRASVMDYPHPYMKIRSDGSLDWSQAYDNSIGEWDKVAINYAYRDFPTGTNEDKELEKILRNAWEQGLWFITDQDARPQGSAHPQAHLWDNGENAIDQLNHVMRVRSIALSNFGVNNIRNGAPFSSLENVLVPLYLHHRYQVIACSKMLGGLEFRYALKNDGQPIVQIVEAKEQRRALNALLKTINIENLSIPENVLALLPPRAFGYPRTRETFNVYTGVAFDALAAAETASELTLQMILQYERAARLVEYHARDSNNPSLSEVINKVLNKTWYTDRKNGMNGEIQRVVDMVTLYNLMKLVNNVNSTNQVKAETMEKIVSLKNWLIQKQKRQRNTSLLAHYKYAITIIDKFEKDTSSITINQPLSPPAGSPIGTDLNSWCNWN